MTYLAQCSDLVSKDMQLGAGDNSTRGRVAVVVGRLKMLPRLSHQGHAWASLRTHRTPSCTTKDRIKGPCQNMPGTQVGISKRYYQLRSAMRRIATQITHLN
jgi:hypothetical protein